MINFIKNGTPAKDAEQFNWEFSYLITEVFASVTGASTMQEWACCAIDALDFIATHSKGRD
jgi:hypothetical protein